MINRGIVILGRTSGSLNGWMLKFNKKASAGEWSFANIEKKDDSIVEGIVFTLNESELVKLDKFEGAPNHYRREIVNVTIKGNTEECVTYVAQEEHIVENLRPKNEYMDFLIEGSALLSPEYQKMLISYKDH